MCLVVRGSPRRTRLEYTLQNAYYQLYRTVKTPLCGYHTYGARIANHLVLFRRIVLTATGCALLRLKGVENLFGFIHLSLYLVLCQGICGVGEQERLIQIKKGVVV